MQFLLRYLWTLVQLMRTWYDKSRRTRFDIFGSQSEWLLSIPQRDRESLMTRIHELLGKILDALTAGQFHMCSNSDTQFSST